MFTCLKKNQSEETVSLLQAENIEEIPAAALPEPEEIPAGLSLQELVNLLPKITVGIMTYNCGNEVLPPKPAEELKKAIAELEADIVFFSFQEAKRSADKKSLVTQLLDQLKTIDQKPLYTLLEYKEIYTPTHLDPRYGQEAWDNVFTSWSRAKVAVAYNNTTLSHRNLQATPFDRHTPWSWKRLLNPKFNFDNKGGMFNTLPFPHLGNFKINFIGAHLDSEDYAGGQEQAEKLIELAHQDLLSGVTFIAGDLNIRIHSDYIHDRHRTLSNTAPLDGLLNTTIPKAIKGSITKWQQHSPTLKRVVFAPAKELTYCHRDENDHITYSTKRKTYNMGALDLAGYTVSPNSRTTVIQTDPVAVVAPTQAESAKHVSDHKAVVTKYTVLPEIIPEMQRRLKESFAVTPLDEIHQILINANHPDLMRTYFEFVHAATTPADTPLPYPCENMSDRTKNIIFIIDHLDVLFDRDVDVAVYDRLIFEQCHKIEAYFGNAGVFMRDRYHQLLNTSKCPRDLQFELLSPFRKWLDAHNIPRERYTVDNKGYCKNLGFFAGNAPPADLGLNLSRYELNQIR